MGRERISSTVLTWRGSIAESGLPRTTRAVAWALANYMNERGESAFPGVPRLCNDVGNQRGDGPASKTTVIDALRELQEAGYLERVKAGGGRRVKAEWQARFPETVQQVNRIDAAADVRQGAKSPADTAAPGASDEASGAASSPAKRVLSQHPFQRGETVQSAHERVQSPLGNGAAGEPEVEVLEVDQEVGTAAAARASAKSAAAAGSLRERLEELKIPARVRVAALAKPELAAAWLDVVDAEAKRNPAMFFVRGFETGEPPSPRIPQPKPRPQQTQLEYCSERIAFCVREGYDPDEIRYFIDVDWTNLTSVERSELHELLEDTLSGTAPAAKTELRAVDAA